MSKSSPASQSIEQLRERHKKLHERQIKVKTQREEAMNRLAELQQQAREQFGTDDLEQLQQQLADMKKRNQQQQAEYQESLDAIEQQLKEIDAGFTEGEDNDDV